EQCHDEAGIRWPAHLAPFQVSLVSLGTAEAVAHVSRQLYTALAEAGFEVLWDERNERPGVKFKDAELMGIPVKVVVGERGLAEGVVEVGLRRDKPVTLAPEEVPGWVAGALGGAA
ncbi:MAG TPA: His/Gly/Thr/Pro-type tRNA ligase C-terminal domain-containing protein, partial [Mariprofundaceae bacterium]|nr:His/Gly/Thr/Pro-type tRNA ligase C-terminal domain-containing protein [Mariprofundaceae bacterium]